MKRIKTSNNLVGDIWLTFYCKVYTEISNQVNYKIESKVLNSMHHGTIYQIWRSMITEVYDN
jgi:hypothetical protein